MKKLTVFFFVLIVFSSLILADSATLMISGYKKQANLPTDGVLRVYVNNTTSSTSTTVGDKIDVTSYINEANLADESDNNTVFKTYKDLFSIELQTNLAKSVKIEIILSPFVSQDEDKSSVISTSYKITTDAGDKYSSLIDYYFTESGSVNNKKRTYTYNFIKHTPSLSFAENSSSSLTIIEDSTKSTTLNLSVSSETGSTTKSVGKSRGQWDEPSTPTASEVSSWSEYTNSSTTGTLDYISASVLSGNMISVKMKLNTNSKGILSNVEYVAPVSIVVTIV